MGCSLLPNRREKRLWKKVRQCASIDGRGHYLSRKIRESGRAGWGEQSSSLLLPATERMRKMGLFKRNVPRHYVPIHPDNINSKDWIVLLEAGTIVGRSDEKLRVAMATLERKIVTKYNILLQKKHFLVVDGYDPRIHALYYCPQLYKLDSDGKAVPLSGEEIGKLLAQSV